ncbi:hypothetical protein D3C76_1219090 [compost metagenome]
MQEFEYLGVVDHFDFVEQDGKRHAAAGNLFEQIIGAFLLVPRHRVARLGQQPAKAVVQQVDEALQVVIDGFEVDPQGALAAGQIMLAKLLHERGLAEAGGGTDQDQTDGIGVGHLLQQARARQMAVGGFRAGELDRTAA